METSFQSADLNDLGLQLQSFLGECSLRVQCAVRDERLIVLGQHPEDAGLDAQQVLRQLERKIQSLQINFTQQVRLYLRMGGHRQPYAHRWFMIQPPPPPRRLSLPMQHGQTAAATFSDAPHADMLQPPHGGAVAVATRSLEAPVLPSTSVSTASTTTRQTVSHPSAAPDLGDSAESELTWFNSSTSVLDLEHPVLDDEMFRAIGLDDRDLPISSGVAEPNLVMGFGAEEELGQDESAAELASVMEAVMEQSVLEIAPEQIKPEQIKPEQIESEQIESEQIESEQIESEPEVVLVDGAPTSSAVLMSSIAAPDAEEAVWLVGDEELDHLVSQLTTTTSSMMPPEALACLGVARIAPLVDGSDAILDGNGLGESQDAEITAAALRSVSSDAALLEQEQDSETSYKSGSADSSKQGSANQPVTSVHGLISSGDRTDLNESPTPDMGTTPESLPCLASDLQQESNFNSFDSLELDDDACDYEALYLSEAGELAVTWPHHDGNFHEGNFHDDSFHDNTEQLPAQQIGDRVRQLSQIVINPVRSHVDEISQSPMAQIHGRRAIAVGVTVMGVTGALYTLTRPCVIGACPQIGSAQELGDKSSQMLQQAESWKDLERASTYLNQAVETLEPIPMWSGYASEAKTLLGAYGADLLMVETLLDVEEIANTASRTSQDPLYSLADWESVRSLWQQAISQLEDIPSNSHMYAFAREQLRTYRQRMAWVDQHITLEENAREALDKAKQAAQLAEARQGSAQSLEHWQFARVTWIVALDRLQLVPQETLAFLEAEPLTQSYQTSLEAVTRRVEREQDAQTFLTQAKEQAAMARTAEQRLNWQQAVSDWTEAIASVENVEDSTSPHPEAEDLRSTYNQALSTANEKLLITERIQIELERTCIGEIRICNLLSVGEVIKIRLDDSYVSAIEAARSSGNNSIQAVVTDHQLILRRALEAIANEYDLPVEVYNPQNTMLERHSPRE